MLTFAFSTTCALDSIQLVIASGTRKPHLEGMSWHGLRLIPLGHVLADHRMRAGCSSNEWSHCLSNQ